MKGGLEREGPGRMPLRRDGSRRRGPPSGRSVETSRWRSSPCFLAVPRQAAPRGEGLHELLRRSDPSFTSEFLLGPR